MESNYRLTTTPSTPTIVPPASFLYYYMERGKAARASDKLTFE